jgi:hypothetical protein
MGTRIRQGTRLYIGRHPRLFFGAYSARPKYRDLLVDEGTKIVIEGFPRSGNTFAVFAFRHAQRHDVPIAHHLHAPAQVIRAVELGVPAVVLVRDPLEAVPSLILRDPRFSMGIALRYYVSFYEAVAEQRDGYVLATFEDVTRDYGAVIERVNARFDTGFAPFEHTEDNVARVFSLIEESHRAKRRNKVVEEEIAIPSAAKSAPKGELKGRLWSPEFESLTRRARAAYDKLVLPSL